MNVLCARRSIVIVAVLMTGHALHDGRLKQIAQRAGDDGNTEENIEDSEYLTSVGLRRDVTIANSSERNNTKVHAIKPGQTFNSVIKDGSKSDKADHDKENTPRLDKAEYRLSVTWIFVGHCFVLSFV